MQTLNKGSRSSFYIFSVEHFSINLTGLFLNNLILERLRIISVHI